jgi:putative serine protease PepD
MSTTFSPPPTKDTNGVWRPRGRRPLAVLLVTTAMLGGATSAGVLVAAGAFKHGGATTTTVLESSSCTSTGLQAKSIYASASQGTVEITASGVTMSQPGPFGGSSQSTATGSGFVVDGDGHIVTAAHVVDGATSIKVTFSDGTTRTATLAGKDDATDVAVLKVDPSGLTLHPLKLGSSSSLEVGDVVAAIGARSATRTASAPASSPAWTARSRRPTATRSRTRSRPTPRSTRATPAALWSTRPVR